MYFALSSACFLVARCYPEIERLCILGGGEWLGMLLQDRDCRIQIVLRLCPTSAHTNRVVVYEAAELFDAVSGCRGNL